MTGHVKRPYALESEQCRGRENSICVGAATRFAHDDGVVRDVRHHAGDRLLLAAALPAGRAGVAAGSEPCSAPTSQPDAGGNRGGGVGAAASAHELGSAKVETRARAREAAAAVAGNEHDWRDGSAGRIGGSAQEAAACTALHATVCIS